jgi:hypothetical protein
MDTKRLMAILVVCGVLVCSNAMSQEWYSIQEDPELVAEVSSPELAACGPYVTVGTSLTINFNITELSPWAYLYVEAMGVDPDAVNYQNKVFFNNQYLGDLAGFEGFNCNEWDTLFMAMIGNLLVLGPNEIRIESGYNDSTGLWDDFMVQHLRIYPDTVPTTTSTWSRVKAVYR